MGLKKTPDPIIALPPTALTAAALGAHGAYGASVVRNTLIGGTTTHLDLTHHSLVLTARINGNLQALQITGAAP